VGTHVGSMRCTASDDRIMSRCNTEVPRLRFVGGGALKRVSAHYITSHQVKCFLIGAEGLYCIVLVPLCDWSGAGSFKSHTHRFYATRAGYSSNPLIPDIPEVL